MVSKIFDFYGQGESRDVLLARIKDWLYSDVEDARDFTAHIKLVISNKSLRELFEDVNEYGEKISK